jgi:hypothetical protein
MRAARLWVLLPLSFVLGGSGALERPARTAAPAPTAASPAEKAPHAAPGFEARLDDDSLVRLVLLQPAVVVQTPYGKLTIPAKDVRQIEFGHHPPAGTDRRVSAAVANLGARTFAEREAAGKELLELGPWAYDAVLAATKATDPEVVRRAKALVQKIEGGHSEERLARKWHDLVETPTFTVAGRIEGVLKVKTSLFGESQVGLAHVWSLRSLETPPVVRVTIDAGRYAGPGVAWLETAVRVRKGARLKVTATGQIDMYPVGGGRKYLSTPAGATWMGARAGMQQPGTLVGRVGVNGQEFVVGEKWDDKAPNSGKLFLRIVQSPWGNVSRGEYKATIAVK